MIAKWKEANKLDAIEVQRFLASIMVEGSDSKLHESYHDLFYELYKCAPEVLLGVVPNLMEELLVPITVQIFYDVCVRHIVLQVLVSFFTVSPCQSCYGLYGEFLDTCKVSRWSHQVGFLPFGGIIGFFFVEGIVLH